MGEIFFPSRHKRDKYPAAHFFSSSRRYDASMNAATLPKLITIDDASRRLWVPVRTMRRWIADRLIRVVALPNGEPVIAESDLAEFIERHKTPATDSPIEI